MRKMVQYSVLLISVYFMLVISCNPYGHAVLIIAGSLVMAQQKTKAHRSELSQNQPLLKVRI